MRQQVLPLLKPVGMTPFQLITLLKEKSPSFAKKKLGFAGRLDPMAEGIMLILVDEENKKRRFYENLPKSYTFSALFSLQTDTYDTLGKITATSDLSEDLQESLEKKLPSFLGKIEQPYPPYSSRTVHGKPLYYYARRGLLGEITIPTKIREIFSLSLERKETVPAMSLKKRITTRIQTVQGNFRQNEILTEWETFFRTRREKRFLCYTFQLVCSSGTYVRSLVHAIGTELGCGGITLSIERTKVGPYSKEHAFPIASFPLL